MSNGTTTIGHSRGTATRWRPVSVEAKKPMGHPPLMEHFLSIEEAGGEAVAHILDVATRLRAERLAGKQNDPVLSQQTLVMIFEKPSLRTRVSFEQAMLELGGRAMVLRDAEVGLGMRESTADVARVLSGMVHGIVARVFDHQKLIDLSGYSGVPVINALSDESHPCQALADVMTLRDEFGPDLKGRKVAFVGDGNNVSRSLAVTCATLGIGFALACPEGFELDRGFIEAQNERAGEVEIRMTHDVAEAVRGADAVYTDTWISMGEEDEKETKEKAFADYQVNAELLKLAPAHAIVLHCLPAHRGSEITDEVIDGRQSRVFPQAHNRLHAQKGLLAVLMGDA